MSSKNWLKKDVLKCVEDLGKATSRSVAYRLGVYRESDRKKISLELLKCRRQYLVNRTLRKRGRVREYVYVINDRGRRRLNFWRRNGEDSFGSVNIEEIINAAKSDVIPLLATTMISVMNAEEFCEKTVQEDLFSIGKQSAWLSTFPFLITKELVPAFAARRFLEIVSPRAWRTIQSVAKKSLDDDTFVKHFEHDLMSRLLRLDKLTPPLLDYTFFLILMNRKLDKLDSSQWGLYFMLREEETKAETYRCLFESEREKRLELQKNLLLIPNRKYDSSLLHSSYNFDAIVSSYQNLCEICRSSTQRVIETDPKS